MTLRGHCVVATSPPETRSDGRIINALWIARSLGGRLYNRRIQPFSSLRVPKERGSLILICRLQASYLPERDAALVRMIKEGAIHGTVSAMFLEKSTR